MVLEEKKERLSMLSPLTLTTGLGGDRRVVALFPVVDAKTAPHLRRREQEQNDDGVIFWHPSCVSMNEPCPSWRAR